MSSQFSRIRLWLARAVLCAGATGIALLGAELAARVLWGKTTVLFPRYHAAVTYGPYQLRRLRPHTTFRHASVDGEWLFTTNAQGFRDTCDWKRNPQPGVLRVLVLGDSHTQGFECQQERTFCAVLERRLCSQGQPAEVLNSGVSGMGTAEQLAFLENEGLLYRPGVVVLAWSDNDFDDSLKCGLFAVRDGELVAEKFVHQPGVAVLTTLHRWALLRWLGEHSHFYSVLFNRVWDWQKPRPGQQARKEWAVKPPTPGADVVQYERTLAVKLLERMHAACTRTGARLVIVEVPSLARSTADDFESSIPPALLPAFRQHCDALLTSEEVFGRYRGTAQLFVAHGQRHLCELGHLLLGLALADALGR